MDGSLPSKIYVCLILGMTLWLCLVSRPLWTAIGGKQKHYCWTYRHLARSPVPQPLRATRLFIRHYVDRRLSCRTNRTTHFCSLLAAPGYIKPVKV